ncbi:MAG: family 20 glycosylhydrolase, partial [Clostridia bacterium]|nr:family 20 glycosylhydrolase [Clostridia bacterium]
MKKKNLALMLDCSRNAVMKPAAVKELIDYMEKMGYNMLQLYTEDTYEIPGEPYFGYMRGRYSQAEIRDIDAYAAAHGVELVPCIQTLAHLDGITRWGRFRPITDLGNILLADEEGTYELIDKMFASLAASYTSRNVHIGMDEAHMVGLGQYLKKHGYQNRTEILIRHLT